MKHTIQPFHLDKIYEIVVTAQFAVKAQSEEEAKQKLEALLAELDADSWYIERICEVES